MYLITTKLNSKSYPGLKLVFEDDLDSGGKGGLLPSLLQHKWMLSGIPLPFRQVPAFISSQHANWAPSFDSAAAAASSRSLELSRLCDYMSKTAWCCVARRKSFTPWAKTTCSFWFCLHMHISRSSTDTQNWALLVKITKNSRLGALSSWQIGCQRQIRQRSTLYLQIYSDQRSI